MTFPPARCRLAALGLGALAALALAIPAGAGAGTRGPAPPELRGQSAFDFSIGPEVRDAVLAGATASSDRKVRRGGVARYPVGDGAGRTVAVSVSPACASSLLLCDAADPQAIASFLGTLVHGDEMSSLLVQLMTPEELERECDGAQACYYIAEQRMVIDGNDYAGTDGSTRDFVVAHEYGHHVANNRNNSPFNPAVSYGPKYWTTYERVCEGVAARVLYPGDQGAGYFSNPGEAFAEAYAFNRFKDASVPWFWIESLKPDAGSFAAIDRDALDPWSGPAQWKFSRRFGKRSRRVYRKVVTTPLDGTLDLRLTGTPRANLNLSVRGPDGRVIGKSSRPLSAESVSLRVCGVARVTVLVKRARRDPGRFALRISRP